jgi:hydrogenase nickel incorporation protein HypA/HybF
MHEFGLCGAILQAVERRARGRRVRAIGLRVGAVHRVEDAALREAFAEAAQGTVADGARLDLEEVPARLTCRSCGAVEEVSDPFAACPRCRSVDVEVRGGDDLMLKWIRVEGGPSGASDDMEDDEGGRSSHVSRYPR